MHQITGYNKFIEELKVLYAQYWPEDAGALMERLRLSHCVNALTLQTRAQLYGPTECTETQMEKTSRWTDGVTCCCQQHLTC